MRAGYVVIPCICMPIIPAFWKTESRGSQDPVSNFKNKNKSRKARVVVQCKGPGVQFPVPQR